MADKFRDLERRRERAPDTGEKGRLDESRHERKTPTSRLDGDATTDPPDPKSPK